MSVYKAINTIMGELSKIGVSKNDTNSFDNYKFRGIDAVYNAMSPLLAKHGLVVLPRMLNRICEERTSAKGGALFYVTVEAEFDFVSVEDGSKHVVKTFGEAMDRGDKATNKAMSAAYKYACFQAFCIPTEGDNDADNSSHEVIARIDIEAEKEALGLINNIEELNEAWKKVAARCKDAGDTKAHAEIKAFVTSCVQSIKKETQNAE